MNFRTRLYHKSHPTGLLFTEEEKYNEALALGWVEAPWLVHEVEDAGQIKETADVHGDRVGEKEEGPENENRDVIQPVKRLRLNSEEGTADKSKGRARRQKRKE